MGRGVGILEEAPRRVKESGIAVGSGVVEETAGRRPYMSTLCRILWEEEEAWRRLLL